MAPALERNWTAHLVISSEHAGLKPWFKSLEDEIYHVLANIEDPLEVKRYLTHLKLESQSWFDNETRLRAYK